MATFTTTSRAKVNWNAPAAAAVASGSAYELIIGDSFKLNIGASYHLTIQPAVVAIQWTSSNKSTSHNWPGVTPTGTNYLDIGSGYDLLISDTDKLNIGFGGGDTTWTETTKSGNYTW